MATINSAIAAFIKATNSKELTLIDLYENKETIAVSVVFLESISEFFKTFSRYDVPLLVPVEAKVAKRLLEFVQGQHNELDEDNLHGYFKLASVWKMDVVRTSCFDKIKTLKVDGAIKLYAKMKDQKDLPDELRECVIKNMMSHVAHIVKPDNIKLIDFTLIKDLLSRDDYETGTNLGNIFLPGVALEDTLCNIMLTWFTTNLPDVNEENSKKFLECWELLRKDGLGPASFIKLAAHPYYSYETVKHQLAPDLVKELVDILNAKPGGQQRDVIHKLKSKQNKILKPDAVKKLKVGDIIDALDQQGVWYISDILENNDNQLRVHFQGWQQEYDELIANTEARFAPVGTFTNGIKHITDGKCGCNKCTAKKKQCTNPGCLTCLSGLPHPSAGTVGVNNPFTQLFNSLAPGSNIAPVSFFTPPKN